LAAQDKLDMYWDDETQDFVFKSKGEWQRCPQQWWMKKLKVKKKIRSV
jgi:hypothetical protein